MARPTRPDDDDKANPTYSRWAQPSAVYAPQPEGTKERVEYVPTLPKVPKSETVVVDGERIIGPNISDRTLEAFEAYFYDGLITAEGDILKATRQRGLIEGRARDASPEYWRFLDRVNEYATMYPTADPRVWVPLAKRNIRAGSDDANQSLLADAKRLADNNDLDKPRNGVNRKGSPTPTEDDDTGGGGFFGWLGEMLGASAEANKTVGEMVARPLYSGENTPTEMLNEGMTRRGLSWTDTADATPVSEYDRTKVNREETPFEFGDPIQRGASALGGVEPFRDAVRHTLTSLWAPIQAIQGNAANITDDLSEGDYKSALLHFAAGNPIVEAAFIAAENVTGTQFYREGGEESGVWSQTQEGQWILDATGQGRGEQFGQYDDPVGIQSEDEDGFLPNMEGVDLTPGDQEEDPSTAAQWQRQTRLRANTILPEQQINADPEQVKQLQRIARMRGEDEAAAWASEQGYIWDPVEETLTRPAQGWTIGRWSALTLGQDPYTARYNTISGTIDALSNIVDPTLWIPAGTFRGALRALRGGEKIAGGGVEIARAGEIAANADTLWDDLIRGVKPADLERKYGGTFVFSRPEPSGGRIHIRNEDIEPTIQEMIDSGQATTRESALLALSADGWDWQVKRQGYHRVLDKDELAAKMAAAEADPNTLNPNLIDYSDSGMGGNKVDDHSVVGYVRSDLLTDMGYNDVIPEKVSGLADNIAQNGIEEPLVVIFDPTNGRAVLGEGNHRLAALRANGQYWAPVRVVRGSVDERGVRQYNAKTKWTDGAGDPYWPSDIHPRHIFGDGAVYQEGRSELGNIAKEYGGIAVTAKAVEFFNSREGYEVARAISEMTNGNEIWMTSGRRFTPDQVALLREADTPEKVMEILAPRLGARVEYVNDLFRFIDTTKLPNYSTRQRLWKFTDVEKMRDTVPRKINNTTLIPDRSVNVDDLDNYIDTAIRFIRVIDPQWESNPQLIEAFNRAWDTALLRGYVARAARYEAAYGRGGQKVLVAGNGDIILDHHELAHQVKNSGLDSELALDEIIAGAGPGAHVVSGNDGIYTVIERLLVEERGMSPSLARRVMEAWDPSDVEARLYDKATDGTDWHQIWSKAIRSEPSMEADALGLRMPVPNIDMVRKADSRWRHAIAKYRGTSEEELVEAAYNALAEKSMRAWKDLVLTAGGARLPVYILKATADTHLAVALNGGASIVRDPLRLIGYALTSSVKKATAGDSAAKRASVRWGQAIHDHPAVGWMFPDQLAHDVTGSPFADSLDEFAVGNVDHAGLYHLSQSLNVGTFGRGSQGRDVAYYRAGAVKPIPKGRDVIDQRDDYVSALADTYWRAVYSPTTARVAGKRSLEDVAADSELAAWFAFGDTGGREVIRRFGPEQAASVSTPEGVQRYLADRFEYVKMLTGGDDELMDVIASGKVKWTEKVGDETQEHSANIFTSHRSGDIQPHKKFVELLRKKVEEGVKLPQTVYYEPKNYLSKPKWDTYMNGLYHFAGKIEDVYVREPYFKERYFAHVERFANLLERDQRKMLVATLRKNGDDKFANKIEKLHGDGVMTLDELNDAAGWLAFKDIRDVAYNAADRREWAYALRFVSPFAQAAVNGMYRWVKAAIRNPESDYRIFRGIMALTGEESSFLNDWLATSAPDGSAFIYEDEYGQRQISVPGTGLLSALLPAGPEDVMQSWSFGVSGLNLAFPGYERAALESAAGYNQNEVLAKSLFPGFGPVINIPLSQVTDGTSEWIKDWVQPFGTPGQGIVDNLRQYLVPSSWNRVMDLAFPTAEEERRQGTRALQFYAMIVREQGGLMNMTKAEQKEAFERAKDLSKSMSWMQVLGSLVTPTATGGEVLYKNVGDIPDHIVNADAMHDIFQRYVVANNYNFSLAEAEFVNDVGLETLMLTAPSSFDTDVAPPTKGALAVKQEYPEGYEQYAPVLNAILAQKDGTSEFDSSLYAYQLGFGDRVLLPLPQRLDAANERIFDYIYSYQTRRIADADASETTKMFAMNRLESKLQKLGWHGQSKGRSKEDRQTSFDLMEQAANDPRMRPFIGEKASDYLRAYFAARREVISNVQELGIKGDLAQISSTGADEKASLFALGEIMAQRDANFRYIWWYALRSEVISEEQSEQEEAA